MSKASSLRNYTGPATKAPAFVRTRETVATMVSDGRTEEAFDYLLTVLAAMIDKSQELELLLAKMRRVGRSSERVDPGQLALLFEELVAQLAAEPEALDPEAEARQDAELEAEIKAAEAERQVEAPERPQWWRTAEGVERQVHTVELPAEQRACVRCGGEQRKIGEDTSPVLEYVPGRFVVHEYRREKWACGTCKRGVVTAPAPERVIERSPADASLLAHVVVSKFADHTPLHRLHRIYERTGATIAVSTLSDWAGAVGDLVGPLVERVAERIVSDAHVAGTDATGLRVLDPTSAENIQRGTIWTLVGDKRDVVFRYTPTGEGEGGPWQFLAERKGYLQADAANVFDRLYNGQVASAVEVGCWAHARRKFVALQDTDCRVAYPIKLIGRLYRFERLADVKGFTPEQRGALRGERSRPVLDTLKRWMVATLAKEPPSSNLAKACAYAINHWTALTRFLEDGRLAPDNNICERQLRAIALGRKNYLFAGSHRAAHRAANLYSLLATAKEHGVPLLPYLTDVLPKLARRPVGDALDELLPDRWQLGRAPP
jgi:transposase